MIIRAKTFSYILVTFSGGQRASEVSRDMLDAALAPFFRSKGLQEQDLLLSCLDQTKLIFYQPLRNKKDGDKTGSSVNKTRVPSRVGTNERDTLTTGQPSSSTNAVGKNDEAISLLVT